MKLLSSYLKEMKLAFRGFYFYIEIFVAIVMLIIILVAVKENPTSKGKEFLYYNMPEEVVDHITDENIKKGNLKVIEPTEFVLKPMEFEVMNEETGEVKTYNFSEEKTVMLKTFHQLNPETGNVAGTVYTAETEEDLIRLSYTEGQIGATVTMDDSGGFSYRYFLQGYETKRLVDLLYIIHNESTDVIDAQKDKQVIRELGDMEILNNRENLIPVFITFAGSLMGFFIVMAYIFLDKGEGVIKALAVSPYSMWNYLLSKIGVILTTVVISSSIITIPIMGAKPNYLFFYLFLIITTFAFTAIGLFISSFFDSITKSFGVLYLLIIVLMLPAFSYYIPSFDPVWLRFFPTYPVLQGFKDILLNNGNIGYILTCTLAFLTGGVLILLLANNRYKKTLSV